MSTFVKAPLALLISATAFGSLAGPAMARQDDRIGTRIAINVERRDGRTLYCISQRDAGPAAAVKTCRTRAQWDAVRASARPSKQLAERD